MKVTVETDAMPLKEFSEFLTKELDAIRDILDFKSADYSTDADKLANFKLQARMDGISPIEALRGNWLKHRASLVQGLDELERGKVRPLEWWQEKLRDDRNYNILLHALIQVSYFGEVKSDDAGIEIYKHPFKNFYYIAKGENLADYLWRDLEFHQVCCSDHVDPTCEGYYPSEKAAKKTLRKYLEKVGD